MIEPITKIEFYQAKGTHWGKQPSPEGEAFRALAPGSGVKVPCRWNHRGKTHVCSGGALARATATDHGFRVQTRCKDKVLYVWRPE